MKIAIARQRFALDAGGAERYALDMVRGLQAAGHEIHILAQQWDGVLEENGAIIHPVPSGGVFSFMRLLSFALGCRRILQQAEFDIVYSHQPLFRQDVCFSGCHRAWLEQRKRHFSSSKRLTSWVNPMHPTTLWLESRALSPKHTRAVIAHSQLVRREIIKYYGFPAEEVHVVHNAVDHRRFQGLARTSQIGERFVLQFVGSGFERKGLGTCIRALARLPKSIELRVVGRGSFAPYLKLASELGVADRVSYLGTTSRIEDIYASAELLVHPAIYEPFGMVCLEALASGLPVITSQFTGAADVLTQGVDGIVVDDPSDCDAIASAVRQFLDPKRHAEASTAAREKARTFSFDRTISKTLEVFQRVMEGKRENRNGRL